MGVSSVFSGPLQTGFHFITPGASGQGFDQIGKEKIQKSEADVQNRKHLYPELAEEEV